MKRKKLAVASEDNSEEEGGLLQMVEKGDAFDDDDDDDDEEDEALDQFENDGFLVFDEEDEGENDQNGKGKQEKMKKKKRRSLKDFVLDDDDVDLLEENRISGISQFPNESNKFKRLKKAGKSTKVVGQFNVSDDEGLLLDNFFGEEEASYDSEEDEMANFIVDDRESYRKRSPMRKLNQKVSDQLVTICSLAPSYVGPIIGDANEILKLKKQVLPTAVKPDEFSDFEPLFLAEKYMTERNNLVRETDVPERVQMLEEIVGSVPLDLLSREEESVWILNQLVKNSYLLFCKKIVPERSEDVLSKIKKEDIMNFLELYHREKFDIPFIAMYRKEQCLSLLENMEQDEAENKDDDVGQPCRLKWHRVLWVITELDKRWLLLKKRKSALKMYQRKHYDDECLDIDNSEKYTWNMDVFESISKSLNEAETEEEVNDSDMKFSLHFPSVEERIDGKFKRPIKKSLYSNCMKAGLWKLASQFGLTSEQLGLQITLEKMDVEFREQPDESPEEVASNFTCAMFETPELVLKGARHMAALEISCEPCIKKHIRHIFMEKAVVSTSPTCEGNATIDCFHQFSGVKWLCNKPLSKFNGAQWLLIQKAEEEKLLLVSIKLPEETLNEVITGFNDVYVIDGIGKSAQLWKKQCKLILDDAFFNFLLPSMEKEARKLLSSRAKHWLLTDYGRELWKMVCVGPYSYIENTDGTAEAVASKVMACCWGPGKPATTFVMLNSSGELLDVLEARSFNLRSQTIDDQQRKKHDQLNVLKFMKNHKPHVVIGAANSSCLRLKEDVKELVSKLEESHRDHGQAINGISVVYGDESLPQLYENLQISSDQLPGQPGIVKRAVALGRYLQNPLAMVATLCGANREILSLKLSSLEHLLTPDEKYEMIEQVMIDVTNQVGVEINLCLTHDWYFPLLQFVSGLGPQKAACLQRELMGRSVNNRLELAKFGIMTKKIFHNAVGFLCIRGSLLPCTSFDIDMLDGTRIHPESYELAEGLAKAVCNDITVSPFEYIKKESDVMSGFNINEYSDNYEREEDENKKETFLLIKNELLHGYLDPRNPYREPSPDEEFNMICGQNGASLAEGRVVQAIVRNVQSQRAFCVLDSGLTGIIMKDDFSDEDGDFSMGEMLREGDTVSCKIKQVDKIKCHVLLTCKQSEMKSSSYEDIHELDPYYHESGSVLLNQKACTDEKLKRFFKPRIISHPCFKNMTMDQATEFLSDKDVGECIFRPSSRGPSYLTLTLKVVNELYVHKDIVENGKDLEDMQSFLHIGKTLKIGDDTFGDLHEVMDRYVFPLVKHLKEILGFRKFRRGSKAENDEVLTAEKSEYPMRVVYCLGVSYEHPGTFILSYIRTKNLHHEYVGLLPNGFRFRKRTFEKIEHLMGFFQKNIDSLQHRSPTSGNLAMGTSSGEMPSLHNTSGCRSSDDGFNTFASPGASRKWASCSEDHDGTNQKWGNDIHFPPNKKNLPGGSGGNSESWHAGENNIYGCGQGGGLCDQGPGRVSGWGSSKEDQSGGNEGGWYTSGNNTRGRGRRGRHDQRPGHRGGHTSGWGSNKENESSGRHASGNNMRGRGRGRRGGGDQVPEYGGGSTILWGSKEEDEAGGNNGGWHTSGNNTRGRGRHGGGWNDGRGRGGDHAGFWGRKEEENRGDERGLNGSENNMRGRGRGRGRGRYGGGRNQGPGRGGDNTGVWGGKEEEENRSNEGDWQVIGNNTSCRGRGRYGGGRGGGRTAGWGCTNEDEPRHGRDGWESDRGGYRGSARSGRSFGRGRGYGNERSDNNQRESEFGRNSNQAWNNENRNWSDGKNTNFQGGSSSGNWGNSNVND